MTDAELLAHLVAMFESREEAEHVAVCRWCDTTDRCPDNPVEIARAAQARRHTEAAAVVWALHDLWWSISPGRAFQHTIRRNLDRITAELAAGYEADLEHDLAVLFPNHAP